MSKVDRVVFSMPQCLHIGHIAETAIDAFKHKYQYDDASPIHVFIRGSVLHPSGMRGYLSDWHQVVELRPDEEYSLGLANPGGEIIWVRPRWSTNPYDDAYTEMKLESTLQE